MGPVSRFVCELEKIAAVIAKLIGTGSARAAALYEAFLAGCYVKAGRRL
jgi:hypothetical protein